MSAAYIDTSFEEAILRAPNSVKTWLSYLKFKHDARPEVKS